MRMTREERERSKAARVRATKLERGKRVHDHLGLKCLFVDIMQDRVITDPVEFQRLTSDTSGIFPGDYVPGSPEDAARLIYEVKRDLLNTDAFKKAVVKHSSLGLEGHFLDEMELERLSLVGKVSARLERAGITEIAYKNLRNVYEKMSKDEKTSVFNNAYRNSNDYKNFLGDDRAINLGIGKLTLQGFIVDEEVDYDKKRNVYDALVRIGKPWLDLLAVAITHLGFYLKYGKKSSEIPK